MLRLAATQFANDSPAAIAAIDGFVEQMNIREELADDQPRIIYTTLSQTPKYGWAATCHECGHVCCVTKVCPKNPNYLLSAQCCNRNNHKTGRHIQLKADNPVIRKYVKRSR